VGLLRADAHVQCAVPHTLQRASGTLTQRFEATGTGAKIVAARILEFSQFLRDREAFPRVSTIRETHEIHAIPDAAVACFTCTAVRIRTTRR
jgi:hypothetical protein